MSPAPARKRSGTPSVKHGCALEEGKMLNCVGISREKQQTWQDWLTILLSWDTIKRKPVSLGGCARLMLASRPPVSVSWCWCYIAAVSFMLAAANSCNTGNPFLSFSPLLMTEHIMAPDVCKFAELFKSPVFCSDTQHARCFSWISRNFFFLAFLPQKREKKKKSATSCPRWTNSWQSST